MRPFGRPGLKSKGATITGSVLRRCAVGDAGWMGGSGGSNSRGQGTAELARHQPLSARSDSRQLVGDGATPRNESEWKSRGGAVDARALLVFVFSRDGRPRAWGRSGLENPATRLSQAPHFLLRLRDFLLT